MENNKSTNHKDVIIITCFAANEPRAKSVQEYFIKKGKSTLIISTDFIHRGKYYRKDLPENAIFVKTRPYKRNISVKRLISHYEFSKKAFILASSYSPEMIYVMIPANSLVLFAARFKKKYNCSLIIDIVDLWPESLPCAKIKEIGPFAIWKHLRDKNLKYADLLITECDLYQKKLGIKYIRVPYQTVYWSQARSTSRDHKSPNLDIIGFFYLGSINNIIDINGIVWFLKNIREKKKIELHIVGDGEKRNELFQLLESFNIPYKFYGYIYDDSILVRIASQCHWGINFMKNCVEIGLTMKSVSYFELGLPIINNVKGDTWELIERYNAGINITGTENICEIVIKNDFYELGKQARLLFDDFFSIEAFERQLSLALSYMNPKTHNNY